jgi:hypothetical protein
MIIFEVFRVKAEAVHGIMNETYKTVNSITNISISKNAWDRRSAMNIEMMFHCLPNSFIVCGQQIKQTKNI